MQNIGKGFEISLEVKKNILRTRAWGRWDANFANVYSGVISEKMQEIRVYGNGWNILADFRDFSPQTHDVCDIVMQQFMNIEAAGIKNIVYLGNQETYLLQEESRDVPHIPVNGMIFEQEAEAVAWLLQDERSAKHNTNSK